MYLLTLKDGKDDGAYAVQDKYGHKVLFLFEEEDDAERYAMMLYDEEDADMDIVEVDDDLAIKTCKHYSYKYTIITPNDIVIPPKNDNLQKIRYKNFLSSGNQFTEIDFQQHHTNLIIGTNGAGKSTMLDALTFVLFNKPFRKINKPQLANATNERDCLVEIEFSVNSRDYLVRRGIKPNIFDIEVNGNPLHKEADDRANQRILEESILKVNYKSFTQIVILGSSTFVPFMQLTTANRREVIEDLLDIRIFSAMNSLIKDNIRTKKEQIKSLDIKKDNLKDKMKMQEEFIEELESRGNANIKSNSDKID